MKVLNGLFAIAVTCSIQLFAEVPVSPVVVGELENGLTYYVHQNAFPKNRACLYLVVKAGSINETDSQQGLAHFLEHMVFRGSENFDDWEVINYMEDNGSKFGPHTNAFTSFDITAYQLDIALDNPEILDKTVLILSDYAGRATLDHGLINKEREVVMDEMNLRGRNSMGRISEEFMQRIFAGSIYADRLPIGKEEVVRHCDPVELRNFYEKWYTPDRMALIAVGDFDEATVIASIENHFGSLKKRDFEVLEIDHTIPAHTPEVIAFEDSELTMISGGLIHIEEIAPVSNELDEVMRESVLVSIYTTALNERLGQLRESYPAPFLYAGCGEGNISMYHKIQQAAFGPFEGMFIDGLEAMTSEIEKLKHLGPTEQEFKRSITAMREAISEERSNLSRVTHSSWVGKAMDHFMLGSSIHTPENLLDAQEKALSEITRDDIVVWAKERIDITNSDVFAMAPSLETGGLGKSLDEAFETMNKVVKTEWTESESKEAPVLQISIDPKEDTKYTKVNNEEFGFTTLTLSNGMRVIIHPSELEKDTVSISGGAIGGKTLLREEQYPSFDKFGSYMISSGLANLDATQFQNYLTERNIGLGWYAFPHQRSISGSSPVSHVEDLFKTVRAVFKDKRFNDDAWKVVTQRGEELEKGILNDPYQYFGIRLNELLFLDHPFYKHSWTKNADQSTCQEVAEQLFSDPSEFTFAVVGDVDVAQIEQLASTYLSFPVPKAPKSSEVNLPLNTMLNESQELKIARGKMPHGMNYSFRGGSFDFEHKERCGSTIAALNNIVSFRIIESLRQEFGETYGAGAFLSLPLEPCKDEYFFLVYYTCEHENSDHLYAKAEEILNKVVAEGVTEDEINRAKELLIQQNAVSIQSNSDILSRHTTTAIYDISYGDLADFEKNLDEQVNQKRVNRLIRSTIVPDPVIRIRLVPEQEQLVDQE